MMIFEHWQEQKDALRIFLTDQTELADKVYQVRHALSQAEQNALAEMSDDILRQQAGLLMSCIRQSVSLLEAQDSTQVWVPQSMQTKAKRPAALRWSALALQLLVCLWCCAEQLWFGLLLAAGAFIFSAVLFFTERRYKAPVQAENECRITTSLNTDKLFSLLDGQLRAADRYLNDFQYLNDQLRIGGSDCSDDAVISRASDMMEALYDVADEERETVQEAAVRLLDVLGMQVLDYSEENAQYFNTLPSKNVNRTLRPAILSGKDSTLLQRGTAAVCAGAA